MTEPAAKRPRWTFDEPCTRMERTEIPTLALILCARSEYVASAADAIIIGLSGSDVALRKQSLSMVDDIVQESLLAAASDFDHSFRNANRVGATTPVVRLKSQRYALLGLGKQVVDATVAWGSGLGLKVGSSIACLLADEMGCKTAKVYLPESLLSSQYFVRSMTQSLLHALYSDNRYRTGDNARHPARNLMQLFVYPVSSSLEDPHLDAEIEASLKFNEFVQEGRVLARGQYLAMDIVNAPHNVLNSLSLANEALELASSSGLSCTILDKHACEQRGMGAYLGVARGSETEPQFIHLVYRPVGPVHKKIGIVGTGLLFDTGGYSIKTSMMELMKFDCGGAAAVFGAAQAIAALGPKGVEVHFVVAACENMIGPKAYVASDILTASNGKTIEVVNTDAEGRLTLADALVYVDQEVGCDSIIELSTLTGACMISLGKQICGVWTTDEKLAAELETASKLTGEKAWRMPMATEYNDQLDSIVADYKNCGTRYGGAITAALFLQNFVSPAKPFAHVDIAGPVWDDKKGATGFGVKLITEWITKQSESLFSA